MINSFDTVEELFKKIKTTLTSSFAYVAVKGEISSISYPNSGHIYFKVKDEKTAISCMCLKSNKKYLSNELKENQKMIIVGKINAFSKSSQLYIAVHDALNPEEGTLYKSLEERKKALEQQGYFNQNTKQEIPTLANTIAVITSSQGAVKHDIINRINARRPCKLLFYYSTMQGESAKSEIITGIKKLNDLKADKPEVIILARGGGSLEDLEIFNSEKIVKAVFESKIPIISAIGHETDYSFVDFVADLRASTPTAAAEIVTKISKDNLIQKINLLSNSLQNIYSSYIKRQSIKINYLQRVLNKDTENKLNNKTLLLNSLKNQVVLPYAYIKHSSYKLNNLKTRLDEFVNNSIKVKYSLQEENKQKLHFNINNFFENKLNKLELYTTKVEKYNNSELLKKGFAIIANKDNKIIKNIGSLKTNNSYKVTMQDGSKTIKITNE